MACGSLMMQSVSEAWVVSSDPGTWLLVHVTGSEQYAAAGTLMPSLVMVNAVSALVNNAILAALLEFCNEDLHRSPRASGMDTWCADMH